MLSVEDQRFIIDMGVEALQRIIMEIDRVIAVGGEDASRHGPPYTLFSTGVLPHAMEGICNSQATAYGCLLDDGKRAASENTRMKALRLERVRWVKDRCKGISITQLQNRGLRNASAHIDERYLKALINYGRDGGWLINVGLSHKEMFSMGDNPEQRMIRVYVFSTDEFFLFGERIQLKPLKEEAENILAALGVGPINAPQAGEA